MYAVFASVAKQPHKMANATDTSTAVFLITPKLTKQVWQIRSGAEQNTGSS